MLACGSREEAAAPVDTTPVVAPVELAISRNHGGSQPQNAARVEVSQSTLRLDGQEIIPLERGRVAAAEQSEHVITKLRQRLQAGSARPAAALWINASLPYVTLVEVLHTLESAGVRELSFAVRQGTGVETGFMRLSRWRVVPAGDAPVTFTGTALPWSAFTSHWQEVYDACRAGQYIDCDVVVPAPAQGGELQVDLWARGQAMKVTFYQANAPAPEEPAGGGGPALLEGVRRPQQAQPEEAPPPPIAEGAFNFRHQESVGAESAISNAVRPVCGNQSCAAVVRADATTPSMRVLSMLGAFYPNGFTEPEVAFRIPEER
jgi:biopolymer transport protein ExbD